MNLDTQIEQLLKSENEDDRLLGLKQLAQQGVEKHLEYVYQALGDQSWRVRKEAAEVFFKVPHAAALTSEIIELLHSQDNAGLRNAAVEILVKFGRQAIPELLEELNCNDHDVRKFIVDVLGSIGDERAVDGLVLALEDEDSNVRAAAAENLGKLKADSAAPALLKAMQSRDLMFRFTALEALAQMRAEIDSEQLLPFQNERLLRKALFDCLGLIGNAASIPVLTVALLDQMRDVAEAAALALYRLARRNIKGVSPALQALAGGQVVPQLEALLESRTEEVRRAGVFLLGEIGDAAAVGCLLPLLEDQQLAQLAAEALVAIGRKSPEVLIRQWPEAPIRQRTGLAYLYGEAGCVGAHAVLHVGLRSQDASLRHAAAQSLGRLGDASALAPLVECLNDESEEVRASIVGALSRLGETCPEATRQAVTPLLEAESPENRSCAVSVLGRLQGPEIERMLAFAIKDESPEVRRSAVRAMQGRNGEEQIQTLLLALTDEDVDVRRMATEILGQLRDESLIEALQLALRDDDLWVRSTAVRSLGLIATPEALRLIETALSDPVGLVVIAALETLAEASPMPPQQQLLAALEHADEEVVNAALKLLSGLGIDVWVADSAEPLLNHRNWEVRLSTARSLAACQGVACMGLLEARLLIEGEDLVRLELQDLLMTLNEAAS